MKCEEVARKLCNLLYERLGRQRVLGPEEPVVSKIRDLFLMEVLIKLEKSLPNVGQLKRGMAQDAQEILADRKLKGARIIFDVDPY